MAERQTVNFQDEFDKIVADVRDLEAWGNNQRLEDDEAIELAELIAEDASERASWLQGETVEVAGTQTLLYPPFFTDYPFAPKYRMYTRGQHLGFVAVPRDAFDHPTFDFDTLYRSAQTENWRFAIGHALLQPVREYNGINAIAQYAPIETISVRSSNVQLAPFETTETDRIRENVSLVTAITKPDKAVGEAVSIRETDTLEDIMANIDQALYAEAGPNFEELYEAILMMQFHPDCIPELLAELEVYIENGLDIALTHDGEVIVNSQGIFEHPLLTYKEAKITDASVIISGEFSIAIGGALRHDDDGNEYIDNGYGTVLFVDKTDGNVPGLLVINLGAIQELQVNRY